MASVQVSAFDQQIKEFSSKYVKYKNVPDTKTENGAPAYSSTGNSLVDFFTKTVRGLDLNTLYSMLYACWSASPTKTVKLIQHLRDPRDGKGEKLLGQKCLYWLRKYKPKTYILNLSRFAANGYFKDFLQVVESADKDNLPKLGNTTFIELELFAAVLKCDKEQADQKKPISLCAKWAPSLKTKYHKYANKIACLLFPKEQQKQYRKLLSQLRECTHILERLECAKRWEEIKFDQVPAVAHKRNKKVFIKHQKERYETYLEQVKKGEKTIKSSGIQPHELLASYRKQGAVDDTTEAQWKDLVAKLNDKTNLGKSLAICDVSGSMSGTPMEVSIALGLILSQLAKGPFANKVITFSANPTLHAVTGNNLLEKAQSIASMEWGMNTNFYGVFQLLVNIGKTFTLTQDQMPETLFVFTDMQFDQAAQSDTNTVYESGKKLFEENNFKIPKIVFWNFRAATSAFPVKADTAGVALLSGFSAELMKLILEGDNFTPEAILDRAIAKYEADIHYEEILHTESDPHVVAKVEDGAFWTELDQSIEEGAF
jgi:hypothetical protein